MSALEWSVADEEEVRHLYEMASAVVRRCRLIPTAGVAREDVVQDAVFATWQVLWRYPALSETHSRRLAYRVMRFSVLTMLRKLYTTPRTEPFPEGEIDLQDPAPTPEMRLLDHAGVDEVWSWAESDLTAVERAALALRLSGTALPLRHRNALRRVRRKAQARWEVG